MRENMKRLSKPVTKPIFISIQQEATGKHIKQLFEQRGYTVSYVQHLLGLESSQAIYKWFSGRSLPSIDNLLVLSIILNVSIEEILVYDGDFVVLGNKLSYLCDYKVFSCRIYINVKMNSCRKVG